MEKRIETQRKALRRWLESGHSVTPMEALGMWGCYRLSAQIFALKNDYGMDIDTEMVYEEGGKRYAKYSLRKVEDE